MASGAGGRPGHGLGSRGSSCGRGGAAPGRREGTSPRTHLPSLAGPGYLEEVLGVGGEGGVEHQVMQVGVLLRTMVGKVDEVFEVVVGADVAKVLRRGC